MTDQTKVLSYGAVLWDIIEGKEYIGGAPFNVAAHLAKLGCASSMVTRVGSDRLGDAALDVMKRLGVDTTFAQVDAVHPTGTAEVSLTGNGIPTFYLPPDSAYNFIEADDQLLSQLNHTGFDVICFGTLEQRGETSRNSLYKILDLVHTEHVFYDVNIRLDYYPEDVLRRSFEFSTIVKINEDECGLIAQRLYGKNFSEVEMVERLRVDFAVQVVCVTKGGDGCTVHAGGESRSYPVEPVTVVDTVGSGDAFSGAFLNHYCRTEDPFESACLGNKLGSYVASQRGAIPEYSEEIKRQLML
ncbi:MAG: carbohydrate kinase [Armatimonadota bacterium]|nr:carbohydrate kinase [bacterium]